MWTEVWISICQNDRRPSKISLTVIDVQLFFRHSVIKMCQRNYYINYIIDIVILLSINYLVDATCDGDRDYSLTKHGKTYPPLCLTNNYWPGMHSQSYSNVEVFAPSNLLHKGHKWQWIKNGVWHWKRGRCRVQRLMRGPKETDGWWKSDSALFPLPPSPPHLRVYSEIAIYHCW